jgi:hypothetical protein
MYAYGRNDHSNQLYTVQVLVLSNKTLLSCVNYQNGQNEIPERTKSGSDPNENEVSMDGFSWPSEMELATRNKTSHICLLKTRNFAMSGGEFQQFIKCHVSRPITDSSLSDMTL